MRSSLAGSFFALVVMAQGAVPALENPFREDLRAIAEAGGSLQARFVPVGKEVEESPETKGPFHARRARIGGGDSAVQGSQTVVTVDQGENSYIFDYVQLDEKVGSRGLELVYPLDENFFPVTWEFLDDSGNSQCDLLLYDRRQFPEEFADAYGINEIPTHQVRLPAGAPVLRVRVLPSGDNSNGFATWPVIRTTTAGRSLVIPFAVGQSALRVLFFPERFRQTLLTSVVSTDYSTTVLRFRDSDDSYQFGSGGAFAIEHQPVDGAPSVLNLGMEYVRLPEPAGELLAVVDFESADGESTPLLTPDSESGSGESVRFEQSSLVDAGVLSGQALYLGKAREKSSARVILPASVRAGLTRDQFTVSAWVKLPWGQLGKHELVFWPFRRPVEGIKPFTTNWDLVQLGELQLKVNRADKGDTLILEGFGNRLNERTSLEIGPPGWQHVAITVNGDRAQVYHNGVIKSDVTLPEPITADSLQSGGELEMFKNFWGMLDNVRLHNFALSEKQIRTLIQSDIPNPLLRYPMESVADELTPSIPSGEFPVDAWSWETHNFKPEISFAAEAKGAELAEAGGLQVGKSGILVPSKATLDMGMDRIAVAFWFRPDAPGGTLLSSRGHIKYGFQIKYDQNGFGGVVCGGWNLPAHKISIPTGEWHHFAFCYDNYEMRMFLNGALIKSEIYIPELRLHLVDGLGIAEGVQGAVSDIRIFGQMLGEQEVKNLFEAGEPNTRL